jgi:hypothetical protein
VGRPDVFLPAAGTPVTRTLILTAALLALHASNQPPEIPQIAGARVALVPKTAAGLMVTLENRRSSPLVACAISVTRPGQAAPSDIYSYYFSGAYPGRPDSGPLQPNARRDLELVLRNATGMDTPAMTLAVFADGFVAGTPGQVEAWRTRRREQIDDLAYWVRAFDGMPRINEPAVRDYVAAHMLERAREAPTDPSTMRDRLQRVLELYPSGPDVWIGLDRLRDDARRDLAEQPAKLSAPNEGQAPAVIVDVVLTWERSGRQRLVRHLAR